jgi:hypothetical protein
MNTSGFVLLLPYIEQQALYSRYSMNASACSSTYSGNLAAPAPVAGDGSSGPGAPPEGDRLRSETQGAQA